MLTRGGIRKKLYMAVGALVAIVLVLAINSFQAISAYRLLTSNISHRAAELPLTSALTQKVDALHNSFLRIQKDLNSDRLLSGRSVSDEREKFRHALMSVRWATNEFQAQLDAGANEGSILADRSRERATVDSMVRRLDAIDQLVTPDKWTWNTVPYDPLGDQLEGLDADAQKLPTFLQDRMLSLREDVKGYYRLGFGFALGSSLFAIGMFVALVLLFRHLVVKPFRELVAGSRIIGGGNFDHRIGLGTGDEIAELAESMNQMTDRFQSKQRELKEVISNQEEQINTRTKEAIRNEQLASVGFLAAGVAHEINNPLAAIAWSAEALESRMHDQLYGDETTAQQPLDADQLDTLRENLRRVQDEAFRCKGITEQLLDFSRLGEVRLEPTDLKALTEDVVSMVKTIGQYRCKTIRMDCPEMVSAAVNGQEIKQVVLNLLTNALESVGTEGAVEVRLRQRGDVAVITVEDNGGGMDEEVLQHLFEPFFTSGKEGRGTGIGLSISYRIVHQHRGRMTAHSDGPGRGARLEVTLPLKNAADDNEQRKAA